jgi:hypothetical protein
MIDQVADSEVGRRDKASAAMIAASEFLRFKRMVDSSKSGGAGGECRASLRGPDTMGTRGPLRQAIGLPGDGPPDMVSGDGLWRCRPEVLLAD